MEHHIAKLPAQRLIVALDLPTVEAAIAMVEQLASLVSIFKIGYWLIFKPDLPALLRTILRHNAEFFFDVKLNDIPETVQHGVMAAVDLGASFITVHSDEAMLLAALKGKGSAPIKIMAVPVLTSVNLTASRDRFRIGMLNALISRCDGLIMSPTDLNECWDNRRPWPDHMIIATPGVRIAGQQVNDHQRVGSVTTAIQGGANYVIVGRPILHALDPVEMTQHFIDQISLASLVTSRPTERSASVIDKIAAIVSDPANRGRNGALRADALEAVQRLIAC